MNTPPSVPETASLPETPSASFPIVGIGASAGGLAAFEAFFSAMPATPNLIWPLSSCSIWRRIIRACSPSWCSAIPPCRFLRSPDGMRVQPNCAYIIPPGYDMAFMDGGLSLLEPVTPRGQRMPIDFFFLAGAGLGTLFVNLQLRITRFTPVATQVINLISTDIGRPLAHTVTNLTGYDNLVADIQAVLDTLISREVEVQSLAGAWYLMHIRPYRTLNNVIEGAVLTFVDITRLKQMEAPLAAATPSKPQVSGDLT